MNSRWIRGVLIAMALALHVTPVWAQQQSLDNAADCSNINGSWIAVQPGAGVLGICQLSKRYDHSAGVDLRIGNSVILDIVAGGNFENDGGITVADFARLSVNGGRFVNRGNVYADNRAEIHYTSGSFNNFSRIDVEGDMSLLNTQPQGVRPCLINGGVLAFFDGGNLFNQGCIDSSGRGGQLEIYERGTVINRSQGVYIGDDEDRIDGQLSIYQGGTLSLNNARVGATGRIDNWGEMLATGSDFRVADGGDVRLYGNSSLTIEAETLEVSGSLTLESAHLLADTLEITVPATGQILLRGASTAWQSSTMVTYQAQGIIRFSCFSAWYATRVAPGNWAYREPCRPLPFKPKLPTLPIGL